MIEPKNGLQQIDEYLAVELHSTLLRLERLEQRRGLSISDEETDRHLLNTVAGQDSAMDSIAQRLTRLEDLDEAR